LTFYAPLERQSITVLSASDVLANMQISVVSFLGTTWYVSGPF